MPSSLGETELHPLGRRERLIRLRLSEGGWEENERKGLGGRCPSSLLFLPFFSHSASTMAREREQQTDARAASRRGLVPFSPTPTLSPLTTPPPPLSLTHTQSLPQQVCTEHLLLGLICEETGSSANKAGYLGFAPLTLEAVRAAAAEALGASGLSSSSAAASGGSVSFAPVFSSLCVFLSLFFL